MIYSFEVITVSCDVTYCCYSLIDNINIFYFKMSSTNLPLFSLKINPLSSNVKPYGDTFSVNKNSKRSTRNHVSSSQSSNTFLLLKKKEYAEEPSNVPLSQQYQQAQKTYFNNMQHQQQTKIKQQALPNDKNTIESQEVDETTTFEIVRTPKMLTHRKVQSGGLQQQQQQSRNGLQALRPVLQTNNQEQMQRPMTGSLTYRQIGETQAESDHALFIGNTAESHIPTNFKKKRSMSGTLQLRKARRSLIIVTNHFKGSSLSRKFSNLKLEVAKQADQQLSSNKSDIVLDSHKVNIVQKKIGKTPLKTIESPHIVVPGNKLEETKDEPQPFITEAPTVEVPRKLLKISKDNINFNIPPDVQPSKALPQTSQIDAFKYIMERLKEPSRQPILKITKSLQQMEPLSKNQSKKTKSILLTDFNRAAVTPIKSKNQPQSHTVAKSFRINKVPSIQLLSEVYAPLKSIENNNVLRQFLGSPCTKTNLCQEEQFEALQRAKLRFTRHQSAAVMNTLKQMPGFRPYRIIQMDKSSQSESPIVNLNCDSTKLRYKGSSGPSGIQTSRERYMQFKRASHIKDAEHFLRSRVLFNPSRQNSSRPQTSNALVNNRRASTANFHQVEDFELATEENNQPPMTIQVYCSVNSRNQNTDK